VTYTRNPDDETRAAILRSQGATDDEIAELYPNAGKPKRSRRTSKAKETETPGKTDGEIDPVSDAADAGLASAVTVETE